MGYQAGLLRHRVTVQRKVETQDPETGALTFEWVDYAPNIAAMIKDLSAKEFLAAQQINSQVSSRIVIRTLPGLTASMRIVHGSVVYNIVGILADPDSRLEYQTCLVSQGVNDG